MVMQEKKYKLLIDDLSAIKYEEETEFENSVSADAYEKAYAITKKILRENKKFRELKNKGTTGNKLRNSEQIYNILFFTGAKGSGKTSTMLSYMEYLKDFYRKSDKGENKLSSKDHLMFTGLEYIDASVMDKKEDILGCILSKMLKKWKEEESHSYEGRRMGIIQTNDYSYRKRNISLAFDRVYTNLKNLRSSKDVIEDEDDTFLETLEKLSLSWNLKESFQELVQEYLEIMKYPNTEDLKIENHFLVISIDEADMNIDHGFEIIEQIRQYLMGPNIIVLLSADYDQLEKICDNHFSREFSSINKFENMDKHIKRLTREYLEKIIPSDRRIIMSSGSEWKLLDREEIEVYYKDDKGEPYGEGTIKKIVQRDCKDNLGIELYKNGELIKYFTPNTLREFSTWIKKMSELSDIDISLRKSKAYEWFWGEMFPNVLKKEDEDLRIFSVLGDMRPKEQTDLLGSILNAGNNNQSILEMISLIQSKNIEERKKSNVCMLFLSMKIMEMMQDTEKSKELYDYYSPWGLWGKWEEKMGSQYIIIGTTEKRSMLCNVHCFEFFNLNKSLDIQVKKFIVSANKSGKIPDSEIDMMKNFQYITLFFNLENDINEETNPWEFIQENQTMTLGEKHNGSWSRNGIFSFSNSILNILKGCKLAEMFCECMEKNLKDSGVTSRKAQGIIERLVICRDENSRKVMPFYNLEFLCRLGKDLEKEFAGRSIMKLTLENVSLHLYRYCWIIKENLRKYDRAFGTEYEERFSEFGLFEKILNGDIDFLNLFFDTVQKVFVPEEIGLDD